MAHISKKHFGAGSRGKTTGTAGTAPDVAIPENSGPSNHDKAEHSSGRGQDSKSSTMPILQIRNTNGGSWSVHVEFPDGTSEEISGFGTENDANAWIASDLQRWIDRRRN